MYQYADRVDDSKAHCTTRHWPIKVPAVTVVWDIRLLRSNRSARDVDCRYRLTSCNSLARLLHSAKHDRASDRLNRPLTDLNTSWRAALLLYLLPRLEVPRPFFLLPTMEEIAPEYDVVVLGTGNIHFPAFPAIALPRGRLLMWNQD